MVPQGFLLFLVLLLFGNGGFFSLQVFSIPIDSNGLDSWLVASAEQGDLARVNQLLKHKPSKESIETAIMKACRNSNLAVLDALGATNQGTRAIDGALGATALRSAFEWSSIGCINYLLTKRAEEFPNESDLLVKAVEKGSLPLVQVLLRHKRTNELLFFHRMDLISVARANALKAAIQTNQLDIFNFILARVLRPLEVAILPRYLVCGAYTGARVHLEQDNYNSLVLLAAKLGRTEMVFALLSHRTHPSGVLDNQKTNIVSLAASNGHVDLLTKLLEHENIKKAIDLLPVILRDAYSTATSETRPVLCRFANEHSIELKSLKGCCTIC